MTAAAALLAGALLVAPLPTAASLRLAALFPRPRRVAAWRPRRRHGRWWAAGAGLSAALAAAALGLAPLPVVAVGLLTGTVVRALGRHAADGHDRREWDAAIEAVSVLSAELRAGRQAVAALHAAAGAVGGQPGAVLGAAATSAGLGGPAPAVLREAAGCTPLVAAVLRRVAAGWQLSDTAGASLVAVVEQAEDAARAERKHHRQVAALLAGPRATAALLAGLPAVGLALGTAMGGRPLAVLLHSAAGQVALLGGVLLELAGLAWTGRIVRAAGAVT